MPTPIEAGPLLSQVNSPEELRQLPEEQLVEFTQELRDYLIQFGAQHGGHFGASLGVVEITTAVHYVFNTPADQLVWDVGHQAYGHKLITGRREGFETNRKYKGVSGFPKRTESEYDTFGVGHSSTSISAGLGMAEAIRQMGEERQVVAVIGDGAMSGGIAFEGLNNTGALDSDMIIILNDNTMSIDPNVGALKDYLVDVQTSGTYNRLRDEAWKLLGHFRGLGDQARKVAAKLEDLLTAKVFKPGMFFESLGFRYFGPIDGHDVNHLVRVLDDLKGIRGPKLLHCVTVKGKGFEPAELDQTKWHAASKPFNHLTGEFLPQQPSLKPEPPKYQDVFGETIIELAEQNDKILGITPAMLSGSSLLKMQKVMPDRVYDVAIAEQHAVTFSAGLATQGMLPFCNIYSTFAQRAYDQIIHDVAIQDLKVLFFFDRGGLVGADGATHHGAYDIAYMRAVPNIIVAAPMNEPELRNLMYTAQLDEEQVNHPMSFRYPRGKGVTPEPDWRTPFERIEVGTGRKVSEGEDVAILTIGHPGNFAQDAIAELSESGVTPAHYDLRFVKPLDTNLLQDVFTRFDRIVTVEDGCLMGGFGSAILEWMAEHGHTATVTRLGVPDRIVHQGTQKELWAECGYDKDAIKTAVLAHIGEGIKAEA